MNTKIHTVLDRILRIGTSEEYSRIENEKIRSLNIVVMAMALVLLLSLLTNLIELSWTFFDTILYGGATSIIIITFILHSFSYLRIARVLNFIFSSLLLFYMTLIGGDDFIMGIMYIISLVVFFYFFFDTRFRIIFALSQIFLFSLATYLICEVYTYEHTIHTKYYNRIIVFTLCYLQMFILAKIMNDQMRNYNKRGKVLLESLRIKNAQLESAYKEMEEFAYMISHDIKAPLRNMNTFAGMMSRDINKGRTDRLEDFSSIIQTSGSKLSRMIDDVLSYSKLENNSDERDEWVRLDTVLEHHVLQLKSSYPNAEFSFDEMPTILGNRSKLGMLFQNLMENGVKYNEKKQPLINISVEQKKTDCIIKVSDNGIGIAPEHQDAIFELFRRLHTDEEYEGTGIGLANCKKIVERHLKGNIAIESVVGKGTTFTISIPNERQITKDTET